MSLPIRITLIITILALFAGSAIAGEVVVPFISGNAKITSNGGTAQITIPDFSSIYSSGDPNLPYVEKYVLLPPNADLTTLKIQVRKASITDVQGAYDIAPAPPAVSADSRNIEWWGFGKKQIKNRKNSLVYESDSLYPANFAAIDSVDRLGNYILVSVQFWPYRYNPVKKKLTHLKNAEVVLVFSDKTGIPQAAAAGNAGEAAKLKDLAVNYQQASSWYSIPPATQSVAAASPIPFAIITTQAIVNSSTKLSDYVAHKTSMGYKVTVATEAQWGGGTGSSAAEGIRRWLKTNYLTSAKYALLIGNPNPTNGDVPMKLLWPRRGSGDGMEDAPSDYYYADVTGNWDYNDNGYYGERPGDFVGTWGVDRIPEVMVGRIPYYGSIADLDSILQKIINFEASPTVGGWAQKLLIPMKPLDPTTPCWQLGEAIKNDAAKPAGLNSYRIYEENYGLNPVPEKTPCTEDGVLSEWKKGCGAVFWTTHGGPSEAASVLTTNNTPLLDDTKPAFVYQGSCETGRPEDTFNLGYNLLKNGAIATVSASRTSYYFYAETNFSSSDSIAGMGYIYSLRLIKDHQKCGDAFWSMNSTTPNNIWANHCVMNLYGDPTLSLRWPTSLSIETTDLPTTTVGGTYAQGLVAAGGTVPYTWTIVSGSLPQGLTLSPSGIISGTPSQSGFFNFVVQATENSGQSVTKSLSMTVTLDTYIYNLDSNPYWNCEGMWAFGQPTGQGSINPDPTSGHTGTNVYGYNLNGDYPNNMQKIEYLTTPAINCSNLAGTKLDFWRWLGVDFPTTDHACIEASTDNINWTTIWTNPYYFVERAWTEQTYDISAIADGQPTVYIRWGMGPTDAGNTCSGWNIDDIKIIGTLLKPIIQHTPLRDTEDSSNPLAVTADIVASGQFMAGEPSVKWKAGSGSFNSVQMTLVSGSTYRANIPAQPLGTTVSYYISAHDVGGTTTAPSNAPTQCYVFHVASDTAPPVIVHTPLANTRDTSGPYHLTANVTDSIGVASVTLTWAKNGGNPSTITMTKSANPAKADEYSADIPGPSSTGDWYTYSITATDSSNAGNQATTPSYMFNILPGMTRIYNWPLDSNPGWTITGKWGFGTPAGLSGDPASGHTGSFVYGFNLNGLYDNNMTKAEYLTSLPIDCSNAINVTLKFWRWLGVETAQFDHAGIDATNNGSNWASIWANPRSTVTDTAWSQQSYDISGVADGRSNVQFRWYLGTTDNSAAFCGWNIDDVEIWGIWYQSVAEVGALKTQPDNTTFKLDGQMVSAAYQGFFYIQTPEGYQGIKVLWNGNVVEGAPATIKGVLRTRNGEREIVAEEVIQGDYTGDVKPIGMTVRSLGGSDFGTPPAVQRGPAKYGLNNIGTLVKTAGKVTQIGDGYFYVNDGSNVKDGTTTNGEENIGVRVKWTGTGRTKGEFITITGISTGFISGSDYIEEILPRRGTDINP